MVNACLACPYLRKKKMGKPRCPVPAGMLLSLLPGFLFLSLLKAQGNG